MKLKQIISVATLVCVTGFAMAQQKKAVFIIIDGVSKDVIEKLPTPNLHAIAKEGALLSAYQGGEVKKYNETPTISAPGYNNVLTGVWYNKHNVPDNEIAAPNYHYPTIFRLFKNQYPNKKTAVFSSWEDNRTKLVGDGLPQTKNIKIDYHFDGLENDTVNFKHDKERTFMARIDQAVTDEAAKQISTNAPDLSWVYLEFTDDMGHMYGDSPQFYDAVQAADKRVGQIWEAIKVRKEKYNEDWLIVITTDHGRSPKNGKGHGGQSDRERASWIVTNAKPNTYASSGQSSVVDILPTIARFLEVKLTTDEQRELDGFPLTGNVSLVQPEAVKTANKLAVTWKPVNNDGKVKVWLASTNNYNKTGEYDKYTLVGEAPVKDGKFDIDLGKQPASNIYKIVLEGKYNTANRWVVSNIKQ
ncbi:alkaline phosphatase family protein [Mucilaginibacter limnophilus]|uniref:Alkaline phosphatase family protein n=1 Tax=Mucilaginibacter limnophilus TaxID=1932778 RepID=A0A437MSQ3_9SPHI|nr:alkaline phosphatase family protein [Mucilaginibacter limnophilus]RVU00682.1 alkaline phosphatase family protein [Mucilaginibacter limnophilus]